jgi:RyR domain
MENEDCERLRLMLEAHSFVWPRFFGVLVSRCPVTYEPRPIKTSHIELSQEIVELTERLSEHAHDIWAKQRLADGWAYGPERNDAKKQHPSLVRYAALPESEKQYDRNAALETIKAMLALGYRIEPP